MTTATQSITDEQIRALFREASAAQDKAQVCLCIDAINGDLQARAECARVIAETEAQSTATLHDYATGDVIRPATADEQRQSQEAGHSGAFDLDGRAVYVID
jgi:hypothetical protein